MGRQNPRSGWFTVSTTSAIEGTPDARAKRSAPPLLTLSRHSSRRRVANAKATTADNRGLLDHLVGETEQRERHREPERLGGLHVDDQLELRRHLDRQVAGLFSPEDAIDVGCRLA